MVACCIVVRSQIKGVRIDVTDDGIRGRRETAVDGHNLVRRTCRPGGYSAASCGPRIP